MAECEVPKWPESPENKIEKHYSLDNLSLAGLSPKFEFPSEPFGSLGIF